MCVTVAAYLAMSVDGFIARDDGELDWLHAYASGDEDYGYQTFMQTVDAIVMGRLTYEKVRSFEKWPYDKPAFALASQAVEIPPELQSSVEWMSGEPLDVLRRVADRGLRHVYVDGGQTIRRFLAAQAVQRLVIIRVPVLIGRGIPLLGSIPRDIVLRHVATEAFQSGVVRSEYILSSPTPPALEPS